VVPAVYMLLGADHHEQRAKAGGLATLPAEA
jgi:hypothetical protein